MGLSPGNVLLADLVKFIRKALEMLSIDIGQSVCECATPAISARC